MFNGVIEAKDLPEREKIYLKRDVLGWRVVEPPTKWYHWVIGSKRNAATLLILFLILSLFYLGIKEITSECKKISSDPCAYCSTKVSTQYNLSNIVVTINNSLKSDG